MSLKAVIFDMDGVIVDTMRLHFEASSKIFSEQGLNVDVNELKKLDTMRSSEAFSRFFASKSREEIEEMLAKKYAYLKKKTAGISAFPGFHELVFRLKGKCSLGLVSSSRMDFIRHILEQVGETGSFSAIVGADEVSRGKPDPEGYLKAAKMLGAKPSECVVIEDSIFGVKSAKAAGMKCVALTNTYDRNFLLDADLIVDSLEGLSFEKLGGLLGA
ncbi:MAG: HAD family phosphatase [archaeon]|nr:HAD family phosphatase [archaeon]